MNKEKLYSALGKFAKGMLAGGVAQVAVAISAGVPVTSLSEVKNLTYIILTAFLTGAVLAGYKMATWKA